MTIQSDAPVRGAVDDVELPVDPARRRRAALAEAVAHAEPAVVGNRRGAVGVRTYGPGCVALALRGRFDRAGLERLRALSSEIEQHASAELVIDLAGLDHCDPALARVIARLRIRCLAREARVELHEPPEALAAELGQFRL